MSGLGAHLRARPHLFLAVLVGCAAALLLPGDYRAVTRVLLGWNVAVWLYLAMAGWMMSRSNHERLRRVAAAQAEGAATVLAIVCAAGVASLLGMVFELSAAKNTGPDMRSRRLRSAWARYWVRGCCFNVAAGLI
ncbi:MAG: DUF1345 domain-containing protein [Ideonella sp.]